MNVSALILAKNEAAMIEACIASVSWCAEVVVLDTGSSDDTVALAKQSGARVIETKESSFAENRNTLLAAAENEWVLYIDADERVTQELYTEIRTVVSAGMPCVGSIPRQNIFFGHYMRAGGWERDVVTRLFHVSLLEKWTGVIHESPHFSGEHMMLIAPLLHLTHRSIADGLVKSADWTLREAQLLHNANTSRVHAGTIIRKVGMEFFRRFFVRRGFADGMVGFIEAVTQAFNKFLVYGQLWELQQYPSISDRYKKIEAALKEKRNQQ